MKASSIDRNENEPTIYNIEDVDLLVEELEEVIAPRLSANHNETMLSDAA